MSNSPEFPPEPLANSPSKSEAIIMPPADVRYRIVSCPHSEEAYIAHGLASTNSMMSLLAPYSQLATQEAQVLDFGCGCSRTIQVLHQRYPQWKLAGTDIDEVGINWSREHIHYATFQQNASDPPLELPSETFDLIYALSVFSHLNREMQQRWLIELMRVLKVGGYLYLTFTGRNVLNFNPTAFPSEIVSQYENTGFAYFSNIGDGVLPEWYQTSLQTPQFLDSQISVPHALVAFREGGHGGYQDDMLIRKLPPR